MKKAAIFFSLVVFYLSSSSSTYAHEITFCGERIPVDNDFVATKLMNIIKKQAYYLNMPKLRQVAEKYFPYIETFLRQAGLPEDLKYLPIVESGFIENRTSIAGAHGIWQLMPATAIEKGLKVGNGVDERNDFYASTEAACRLLAEYYLGIRKRHKLSSWVLTAAAYNFGSGNIDQAIRKKGKNYFTMSLNPETAVYVYKIIAIKELFEYPELYLKNFSFNIFNASKVPPKTVLKEVPATDTKEFISMEVDVKEDDGLHPTTISKPGEKAETAIKPITTPKKIKLVAANIKGNYKNFKDGSLIEIMLQEKLEVKNHTIRGGISIKGTGWIINDRIFIDLGYDAHDVILYDSNSKQGISLKALKNNEPIILKVQNDID